MNETKSISIPGNVEGLFNLLLFLYPAEYRQRFGREMRLVFSDMYIDELTKNGRPSLGFWLFQVMDMTTSIIGQHLDLLKKIGVKKYLRQELQVNKYNIVGGFLLLPIITMSVIDLFSRIAQGDLLHYNRASYVFLSHTFLYRTPVLFAWVILFPLLSSVINIIPLIINLRKNASKLLFIKKNIISIFILSIGFFFVLLIRLHDFAPCVIHGIINIGVNQMPRIINFCKNA